MGIILAYPGIMASTVNRIAHELYLLHVPLIPRLMTEYAHTETGIDIHPGASILGGDTVIGHDSVIGGNVFITKSVPANTKVNVKSQALIYRPQTGIGVEKKELDQDGNWYYMI